MYKLVFTFFMISLPLYAQNIRCLQGEYTYYVPETVTLEQAKNTALQRAKIQALADEFGTVVTQSNATLVENSIKKSVTDMISVGGSEVKGEWIETIGEPQYDIFYDKGMLVVKCKVSGKAREIASGKPIFEVHLLRNGTEKKFESSIFHVGDDFYLQFRSPIDGYLNVYLDDGQGHVAAMLPYRSQGVGATAIQGNKNYIFFSAKDGGREVDEYTITCRGVMELNQVILVFSETPFTKITSAEGYTDTKSFLFWLAKLKAHDKKACSLTIAIQVKR